MLSTPPATNTSPSPTAIACAAALTACSPEPHSRLTVWPGDLDGQSGQQQRHAGHVAVVLAGLVGAAEDHVVDEAGSMPARSTTARSDGRGEVVRAHARERAAVAPDRRAHGVDDPGLAELPMQVATHWLDCRR